MAAPKKEEVVKEVPKVEDKPYEGTVLVTSKDIKHRCDFNSWAEYDAYKGPKG
jgi:hypothetical protein